MMLPSAVKFVQNPTVILAIVEQKETPNGHCCSLSLLEPDNLSCKERQLSKLRVCSANDGKLFKFIDLEVVAMKKGLAQGAQKSEIDLLASCLPRTAMLSASLKLQFTKEFAADTCIRLGSDMTMDD